jgi:hypothetical protein
MMGVEYPLAVLRPVWWSSAIGLLRLPAINPIKRLVKHLFM